MTPTYSARFRSADLASLDAVRTLADQVAADGPLTVLVNNVGAMFPDRQDSVDGIEASLAVNHLSPYLLTELLLPTLESGTPSRIVNVTLPPGHRPAHRRIRPPPHPTPRTDDRCIVDHRIDRVPLAD